MGPLGARGRRKGGETARGALHRRAQPRRCERGDAGHDAAHGYGYSTRFEEKLQAVYTFGQPMIASRDLARHCNEDEFLRDKLIRYVYANDIVPQLPPKASGPFMHFGTEYRYKPKVGEVATEQREPRERLSNLLAIFLSPFSFLAASDQAHAQDPVQRVDRRPLPAVLHRDAHAGGCAAASSVTDIRVPRLEGSDGHHR